MSSGRSYRECRPPDDLFLSDLGAHVAAVRYAIDADDGKRDVMLDAGDLLGGKQVAARGLEEFEHGLVLEGRRVCEVDDDRGASECFG